jgi:GNAT superfamily N-acetyltransferase
VPLAMKAEIRRATTKRDLNAFIRLPWAIYRNRRLWVPPLKFDVRRRLDRARNPFFEHGEAEYFLAVRDGDVVGRISAHYDRNFNAFQDNEWGMFGWFESRDDPVVARALLDAAEEWLREHKRDRMVGPLSFTTNDQDVGVLVEGFDRLPLILNQWTQPYYPELLEGAGLTKAMELLMWELYVEERTRVHPAIFKLAEEVKTKHGIDVRQMRKRDMEAEVERFLDVYNEAWERNWGFVPLTPAEVRHYAKELKPILDENWAFIAEKDGQTVGAALTLPDYNQVLMHMHGRLLPIGWLKALWYRRKIDKVRVFALGVKRQHQHTGVAAKLYERHFDSAARTPQTGGEMGWILETNKAMNRAMEGMGGKVVSRYRLYEKELQASGISSQASGQSPSLMPDA